MGKSNASLDKGKAKAEDQDQSFNASKTAKSNDTKVKKPEKIKLRRIHVSGLPDITEQEAKDRFKSFGEVLEVDGLGKLDATGKPLRYAFLNIKTTKSKLAQCMNLLSGSVWKGSTLRIAEAKPTFMERLEQERKQAAKQHNTDPSSPKKDKKRKRGAIEEAAVEASEEPLTSKTKPGWKLDPKTQTPIFPVIMRPDHPLPPPVHIEPVAGPSEPKNDMKATTKASKKAEKAAKKAEKAAKKSNKNKAAAKEVEVSLSPPSRARMVKIDPTQWQAKHLREPDLQNLPDTSTVRTKAVKPVTTSKAVKPDSVKQAVQAQVQAPVSSEEEDSSESDGDDGSSKGTSIVPAKAKEASTTASKAVEAVYDEKASIAERKANLDLVAQLLGGLPKSLAPVQDTIMAQGDASDTDEDSDAEDLEEDLELHQEGEGHQSTSAIEQTSESSVNTEGKDESSSDSDVVNEGTRQILDATLVPEPSADSHMAAGKRDTGSSTNLQPLREADQLSQSAEPESEMETEDALGPASEPVALAEVQMQSLTDMFKPQEAAAGFTIGDLLDDLEVDELEDITPIQASGTSTNREQSIRPAWSAPIYAAAAQRTQASTNTLFFPFPLEEDELPGGILHGLSEQERERLLARSWTGTSTVRRFKRTQTMEEITSHFENVRRPISEQVRKRHREAVKRQKRHGGKRTMQGIADEV